MDTPWPTHITYRPIWPPVAGNNFSGIVPDAVGTLVVNNISAGNDNVGVAGRIKAAQLAHNDVWGNELEDGSGKHRYVRRMLRKQYWQYDCGIVLFCETIWMGEFKLVERTVSKQQLQESQARKVGVTIEEILWLVGSDIRYLSVLYSQRKLSLVEIETQ